MSIRLIARDLYKAEQKLGQLQKAYESADSAEKLRFEGEIRLATKERDMIRKMLDGEKESGSSRKRFDGFGY